MTTCNEKSKGVQKELLRIIQSNDMQPILEIIAITIDEVRADSKQLPQLYNRICPLIPARSKYNKRYWMAAYVLHYSRAQFKELLDALKKVDHEIRKLYKYLGNLEKKDKRRKRKDVLSLEYLYSMTLENLYELQHNRKVILEEVKRIVRKLVE